MSSPTIKDVAKLAGVSISTVSRVMNDSKPVSPESRRRVEDAIKKLDFKRNELARSLVMRRSNVIGVIVKDIGIPYMAQIVRGVEEVGRMYKYDILLSSSYGDYEQEKNIVDFLFRKQAEAILIISEAANPETIVKLKDSEVPFILIDKYYDGNFNTVSIDYTAACYDMTKKLIEEGHKNILFVKEYSNKNIGEQKLNGYQKALKEYGLDENVIVTNDISERGGYKLGQDLDRLMQKEKISAVFASEDDLAIGILNYCYDKKLKVPEDLAVAGFSDSQLSKIYRPTLTTVQEPLYDIGAVAMRRLVKELKKEEKIENSVVLPYQIIERESTGK